MKIKKTLHFIRLILFIIVIVCLVHVSRAYYLSVSHKNQLKNLSLLLKEGDSVEHNLPASDSSGAFSHESDSDDYVFTESSDYSSSPYETSPQIELPESSEPKSKVMRDNFANLYDINNDFVGWLNIPGTVIDYPVMQCDDNEYYLNHDFYGKKDRYGCLFVKDYADIDTPDTNFIIYGHNMNDGSMFGELDNYSQKSYYTKHPTLSFDTLYENRSYEIISVFLSKVYDNDESAFKYYEFYNADTEEEFLNFYDNIMSMSIYDTGVTAEYGDTFITLSTCAYHEEDGRLVVVAKRIS